MRSEPQRPTKKEWRWSTVAKTAESSEQNGRTQKNVLMKCQFSINTPSLNQFWWGIGRRHMFLVMRSAFCFPHAPVWRTPATKKSMQMPCALCVPMPKLLTTSQCECWCFCVARAKKTIRASGSTLPPYKYRKSIFFQSNCALQRIIYIQFDTGLYSICVWAVDMWNCASSTFLSFSSDRPTDLFIVHPTATLSKSIIHIQRHCVCVWHSIFWARRRCGCEGYKKEAIGKRDTTFTTRFADDLTELCVPVFALFCCCCSLQIRCDAASPSSHSMGLTIMSCVRMVISISLLCSYQLWQSYRPYRRHTWIVYSIINRNDSNKILFMGRWRWTRAELLLSRLCGPNGPFMHRSSYTDTRLSAECRRRTPEHILVGHRRQEPRTRTTPLYMMIVRPAARGRNQQ